MEFQLNLNMCRVCMKGDDVQILLGDNDLQNKFEFATRLLLNPNDNMPKHICANCVGRLKASYAFIQQAHSTEESLKAFLTKIRSDLQLIAQATPTENEGNEQFTTETVDKTSNFLNNETTENESQSTAAFEEEPSTAVVAGKKVRKSLLAPVRKNSVQRSFLKTATQDDQGATLDNNVNHTAVAVEHAVVVPVEHAVIANDDFVVFESNEPVVVKSIDASYAYNADEIVDAKEYLPELLEPEEDAEDIDAMNEDMEVLEEATTLPTTSDAADSQSTDMGVESPQSASELKEFVVIMSNNGECSAESEEQELEREHGTGLKNELIWVKDELQMYEDTDDAIENSTASVECAPDMIEYTESPSNAAENDINSTDVTTTKAVNRKESPATSPRKCKKSVPSLSVLNKTRYYCMKCSKDFSTKTNLTRHMATHDGTRPFACNVCGSSFTQNGTLKQHMYTHTGERPFVCKYCDRGFTQYKSMVFHMRRHTGDKPFHCEVCNLHFRQKDGLKTHILKHHMVIQRDGELQTHICIICEMVLSNRNDLLIHMKKHLNSKLNELNGADNNDNADIILELMEEDELWHEKELSKDDFVVDASDEDELKQQTADTMETQVADVASSSTEVPRRVKKYLCRKCFKCFAIKDSLLRHMSVHNIVTEQFRCETCEVGFYSQIALTSHCLLEHKLHVSATSDSANSNEQRDESVMPLSRATGCE